MRGEKCWNVLCWNVLHN